MSKARSERVEGLSRRAVLCAGVGLTAFAAAPVGVAHASGSRAPGMVRFDDGWRFWRGDVDAGERPAFDDSGWAEVHLPHDWSIEDLPGAPTTTGSWTPPVALWSVKRVPKRKEDFFFGTYPDPSSDGPPLRIGPFDPVASGAAPLVRGWTVGGVGWYRKTFTAPQLSDGERAEIRFDGAYSEAEVWLNGVKLGTSVYGFAAFAFDMTQHLKPGQTNVLAVRVSNIGATARWYTGSGINRHVWLNVTGPVRVAPWGMAISTPTVSSAAAEVQLNVELENHSPSPRLVEIVAELREPNGRRVGRGQAQASLPPGGKEVGRITIRLTRPKLWGPDEPNLYTANISVSAGGQVTDRTSTRFGVRSIAVSAQHGLMINGKQVKLKGACIHTDHGILGTAAFDRAEVRKAELLKKHGYNAVRLGHQMFPQAFLDACDELGLIVIDEVFDVWEEAKIPGDYSKHFAAQWRNDLTRMIRQDRNHPSVIFWSIGNEIPERGKPRGVEIAAELRALVDSLDRSRPVTAGINGPTGKLGEPTRRSIDVVGYNYQLKDHAKDHADYPDMVMMSTEQYAADIHDGWRLTEANPWMLGEFVWTGIDYLGEVGVGGSELRPLSERRGSDRVPFGLLLWDYPAFQSGCGEIDILGRRKPQGLYRDVLWGRSAIELLVERPTPEGTFSRIGPWGWPDELESWTWPDHAGKPMTVRVYTAGDEVRLLLNGREVGRKPVLTPTDKLTAFFEVPYAPGELVAVAYRANREVGRKRLETVGAPSRVRLWAERSSIAASPNDLAYIFAEVRDSRGRKVPDAQIPLTFSLEGTGRLKATGSANPWGLKSFTDPRTLTFHGEALAIVQAGYRRGRAVVRVTSPGLRGDAVALQVG
jgi:beta-galactosidase